MRKLGFFLCPLIALGCLYWFGLMGTVLFGTWIFSLSLGYGAVLLVLWLLFRKKERRKPFRFLCRIAVLAALGLALRDLFVLLCFYLVSLFALFTSH